MVRLGAMGDVLHALPAVAMLRRALPEAHIGWVVEQRWRELLCAPEVELAGSRGAGRPLVDEVHLVDTRTWRKHPLGPETRREFQPPSRACVHGNMTRRSTCKARSSRASTSKALRSATTLGFRKPRESPRPLALRLSGRWPSRPCDRAEPGAGAKLVGGDRPCPRHCHSASWNRPAAARQSQRSPPGCRPAIHGTGPFAHRHTEPWCGLGRQAVGAGTLRRTGRPARVTRPCAR